MINLIKQKKSGFTLVELMVSISVFSIVMLMIMGAILSVLDANRKSQSLRSAMDNLNSSLESMTRDIRFGWNYHCGSTGTLTLPQDCPSGDTSLYFTASDGSQTSYQLSGTTIVRTSGATSYNMTSPSPDLIIDKLTFWVYGSSPLDNLQPRVIMVIKGHAGAKVTTQSSFVLETTVSQRMLDM